MWNERRMEWWNERRMEYKKDISSFKHAIRCGFFASCKLIRGKKTATLPKASLWDYRNAKLIKWKIKL